MKNMEVKEKFIELRAKGNSLQTIAVELGVTKQTLINWGKTLDVELRNQKALEHDNLLAKYKITRESKLKMYTEMLNNIVDEVKSRDLTDIKTEKLYFLYMKISEELDKIPTTATFEANETSWEPMKTYWKI
ncbi:hypothetical protein OAL67_00450 [bacterium]|nr:hypothetical protein [bacterium]